MRRGAPLPLLLLPILAVLCSCATNPATQEKQMMVISEDKEIRLGEDADREIRKEYGVYQESVGLERYVDGVGDRLARVSDRPGLVYHFQILDTPAVNAFALPGGFLYVTRGMLEQLNSEDELAHVLGHELAHVTGRHGASMVSKALVSQWALFAVAVLEPGVAAWADAVDLTLAIAFQGYSRKYEKHADRFGLEYAHRAGYNPEAALSVIRLIERLEEEEGGKVVWFLRSHPPAEVRREGSDEALARIRSEDPGATDRPLSRNAYLRRLDGLVVGKGIPGVYMERDRYVNKRLGIRVRLPAGWEAEPRPGGADRDEVLVVAHDGEMGRILYWAADPMNRPATLEDVAARFEGELGKEALEPAGPPRYGETAGGQRVYMREYDGKARIRDKRQRVHVLVGLLAHDKSIFRFYGYATPEEFGSVREVFEDGVLSADFPPPAELDAMKRPRLRIVEAGEGASWAGLAGEHLGDEGQAERLARYNGFEREEAPGPGILLKIPPSL